VVKVCMFSDRFFPIIGGTEGQAQQVAQQLLQNGDAVFVLTRKVTRELPGKEELNGLPVYRLPPAGISKLSELIFSILSIGFLLSHRSRFQVIHFHNFSFPVALVLLFCKLIAKKTILKIPTSGDLSLGNPVLKRFTNHVLRGANRYVCISQEIKNQLLNHGFDETRMVLIPNGVDTQVFVPVTSAEKKVLRNRLGLPLHKRIVVFTGRLVRRKGLKTLACAWKQVCQDNDDVLLLVLGSGNFQRDSVEEWLKEYIRAKNLNDYTLLVGNVDNVSEFLQASDISVLPSLFEGLPNALLEAMACGLPVVATNIGGIIDIARDNIEGILVALGNQEHLYRAITRLLENPELAENLAKSARKRVVEEYSLDRTCRKLFTLYSELLMGREVVVS